MLQVDGLAGLFGISAWLTVNALYTQMPIMVEYAPEGWNLPSYLSILIQCANIAPVLYGLSRSYYPGLVSDSKLIYVIMSLGCASLVLTAFFYKDTWVVFGNPHSVVLFFLVFCMALVCCISSVLFIPFMNNFPQMYLTSYMVGEGLSGFLPSMISFVQGVGGNPTCVNSTSPSGEPVEEKIVLPPRFSTELFFLIIFAIMAISTVSFFLLNNLSTCKKVKRSLKMRGRSATDSPSSAQQEDPEPFVASTDSSESLSPNMYRVLLVLMTILSMIANGALPSVQSYSCLPYGNLAYHLAVNISHIANPIACFLTFFETKTSFTRIFSVFALSIVAVIYVFVTAFTSPHPPLQNSNLGLIAIVSIIYCCKEHKKYLAVQLATYLEFLNYTTKLNPVAFVMLLYKVPVV